jgi:4-carboxymuconolactone decarboxylase
MKKIEYFIKISAFVSLGTKAEELKKIISDSLEIASPEEIREVILQCYLFAGFPAAIEGFFIFREVLQEKNILLEKFVDFPRPEWQGRGKQLFEKIYGESHEKVLQNMQSLNSDLAKWMLEEGYCKTLSRKGLSAKERELSAVGSLAANAWKRQLFSHMRGAVNCGATKNEVKHTLHIVDEIVSGTFSKFFYLIERI